MGFYGQNDIALGHFLNHYCFRFPFRCSVQVCGADMVKHQRHFVHGRGVIRLVLEHMEKPVAGFEDKILCWTWCKRCRQVGQIGVQFVALYYLFINFFACNVCLSVGLSICLFDCLFVCVSVCLSICLSVSQSVCLSVCLSIVCLFVCLSVCLFVCLSVCLFVCLFLGLSVCPSVCLSVHLSVHLLVFVCLLCVSVSTVSLEIYF